jgi:hypothetical protein
MASKRFDGGLEMVLKRLKNACLLSFREQFHKTAVMRHRSA